MAYVIEQDRLRVFLPDGFISLRPVLRINVEVQDEKCGYVELNTAVEKMETVKRMAGTEEKYSC